MFGPWLTPLHVVFSGIMRSQRSCAFLHNSPAIKAHKGLCLRGLNVRPLLIRSINLKASYSWLWQTTFKRSFIDTQTGPAPSMPVIKQALVWHLLIVPGAQRVLATDQAKGGQ